MLQSSCVYCVAQVNKNGQYLVLFQFPGRLQPNEQGTDGTGDVQIYH